MKKVQSDKEFFLKIYDTTIQRLRRYISYKSADPVLVDDILQEVYLEVFRHINNLKKHENIEGWIYKTAENKTKKINAVYYKYYNNKTTVEERIAYEEQSLIELIQSDEYQSILTEDEFLMLMMKYETGYSHREIAKINNISEANSKMKLSRIIKKLKDNVKF